VAKSLKMGALALATALTGMIYGAGTPALAQQATPS
jgi:hypothetical protein